MKTKKPSHSTAVVGALGPVNQATGTVSTPWFPMSEFATVMAVISTGSMNNGATVDAIIEQAKDDAGTDQKVVDDLAITQLAQADDGENSQAIIEVWSDDLDFKNDFSHIRLTVTVGTASAHLAAHLLGSNARYEPASKSGAASVKEIVGK